MLNVEFTLSILSLLIMVTSCLLLGFALRSHQLKKKQLKISELRKEIVYNHAQILELQTEYVSLEKTMNVNKATVLPMNVNKTDTKEIAAR